MSAKSVDTKLPKSVIEAEKQADAMYEKVYKKGDGDTQKSEAKEQPSSVNTENKAETPAEAKPKGAADAKDDLSKEELKELLRKAETRYSTLQGKYNAEVPRLIQQIKELQQKLEEVSKNVNNVNDGASRDDSDEHGQRLIKPDELEEYGDIIDLAKRAAKEELFPTIEQLRQENEMLRSRLMELNEQTSMSTQAQFYEYLDTHVPRWRVLNEDQGFLNWLNEVDPFSGETRFNLLQKAYEKLEAHRVASFFEAYIKSQPAEQSVNKQSVETGGRVELGEFAQPTSSASSSTPVNKGEKKIWLDSEIQKFYADVARGRYRANPEEAKRIEDEINRALVEGRIRSSDNTPTMGGAF